MTFDMDPEEYRDCVITNLRWNKRTGDMYATINSKSGEILVSATLDYCVECVKNRVPRDKPE